jgi:cell division protein FtsQ
MQGAQLRHQPPAPGRKPVPRGASRMVAKEPMSARLPKANFGFLRSLFWPVLLVALGFGTYEGGSACCRTPTGRSPRSTCRAT